MTEAHVISTASRTNHSARERFICIDRIANNGLYIEGDFHSDEWGNFRTYFNFELNDSGRIVRLDIGKVEDVA